MNSLRRLACLFLFLAATHLRAADAAFDAFVDRFAADWVRAIPQQATTNQYFSGPEQDALDRKLNVASWDPAERARRTTAARAGLEQLRKFAVAELSPVQRASHATLTWTLTNALRADEVADQGFVFEQFRGLQITLVNFLTQTHPVRHARDLENYLVRLAQVTPRLDSGIVEARKRAAQGVVPPTFILKATVDGIDRFLEPVPAENVFVTALDERAGKIAAIPAAARAASVATAEKIVRDEVIPAFQRVRALLAEQMKISTDDAGLWRLPRGAEAYASALATNTTTALTPDEIHALGLKEVARIEVEMDQLLRQLGYAEGTVNDRYAKLNATLLPPTEPDPRPALIAQITAIVRDAERRAEALFDLRPKAPVEVRREPPFTERTAAAHYSVPAPDGSKPGIYWAPLAEIASSDIIGAGMKTVAYHEAVPGHHFQLTVQQEHTEIPRFRQKRALGGLPAFTEGWALYAEQLAVEAGWYADDPAGRLGQLQEELFRARRLVVDTGLHVKHWTRQQAIDYGILPSEVERYVVLPGQACAYKIGMLKILGVRAKAQRELGPKFSLKEFHNVVLLTGAVPLSVLEQVVDEWILETARKK